MTEQDLTRMFIDTLRSEVEAARSLRRATNVLTYIPREHSELSQLSSGGAGLPLRPDAIISVDRLMRIISRDRRPGYGPPPA
ncbi:hypothetical protein [Paracoccus sp. IB05]|uniref:hypothetical protein n=1 Tax=Paracoccus sp. IB05 TaxID=2779367 RepID=UPI0018E8A409|nr:hypothetical protein [Paracoccus sp. IB05]MBJ2150828.1 hypothetical protein [Paracoccus sp. IB05]